MNTFLFILFVLIAITAAAGLVVHLWNKRKN